jgi:hypothetical protein
VSKFFGKYRGTVANNVDPLQLGRVQVSCPAVFGSGQMSWALPASPFAGSGVGLFLVPSTGANVWVEFEGGDPDSPIWSGCFWGVGDVPAFPAVAQQKVLKTDSVTITISDLPGAGGLTIEVGPPAVALPLKLAFTSSGIEISNGAASIKLDPATVNINDGALQVI